MNKNTVPYDITAPLDNAQLTKDFNRAKLEIMVKGSVFLSTILFSLKFHWVATKEMPTAATDGVNLYINPYFFRSLSEDERVFLLAHEAWHVAFDHITRGEGYIHKKYNIAADYVINLMLKYESFVVIKDAYIDDKFKDMSTEEVYNLLPDLPEEKGYHCDVIQVSKEEMKEIKEQIKSTLVRAGTQSKLGGDAPGTIPGEIEFYIEELINPKLPWNIILQNYMSAYAKSDYSWSRPNRRYVTQGMYLPIQHSLALQNIALAVDSSYSVSDTDFTMFISEIEDIRVSHNPEMITIVDFDTKIKRIHSLTADDDIRTVNFSGRGGTDLYPVFDHFNENPPTLLIVFSDLECTPIKIEPDYPVIWICVNNPNGKVDFGSLIHIDN